MYRVYWRRRWRDDALINRRRGNVIFRMATRQYAGVRVRAEGVTETALVYDVHTRILIRAYVTHNNHIRTGNIIRIPLLLPQNSSGPLSHTQSLALLLSSIYDFEPLITTTTIAANP